LATVLKIVAEPEPQRTDIENDVQHDNFKYYEIKKKISFFLFKNCSMLKGKEGAGTAGAAFKFLPGVRAA
jgi:hypothetical protein